MRTLKPPKLHYISMNSSFLLLISVNLFYLCSFFAIFFGIIYAPFSTIVLLLEGMWGFQTGAFSYFLEVHFLGWIVWKAAVWPNIRVLSVPLCTQSPPVYLFLGWILGKAASGGEMHLCSGSCRVLNFLTKISPISVSSLLSQRALFCSTHLLFFSACHFLALMSQKVLFCSPVAT